MTRDYKRVRLTDILTFSGDRFQIKGKLSKHIRAIQRQNREFQFPALEISKKSLERHMGKDGVSDGQYQVRDWPTSVVP